MPGVGKTSMVTHAEAPVFLLSPLGSGLLTLVRNGLVPQVPYFTFRTPDGRISPTAPTWNDALDAVRSLIDDPGDRKTLIVDELGGGFERLCHEHVCQTYLKNNWGETGFAGYQRGYEMAIPAWRELLKLFEELRFRRRLAIIALCHVRTGTIKNNAGADWTASVPDVNDRILTQTIGWADDVFFLNYETTVVQLKPDIMRKGKATGGKSRVIYATNGPGHVAKNHCGLPDEIPVSSVSAEAAWNDLQNAIEGGN
ncbi:MAG: AAA family ATPase [Gammaproteobacteria bacterium]